MNEAKTKYHMLHSRWLSSKAATEEGIFDLVEWLGFWHFRYRQWDGHMLIVSASLNYIVEYYFILNI